MSGCPKTSNEVYIYIYPSSRTYQGLPKSQTRFLVSLDLFFLVFRVHKYRNKQIATFLTTGLSFYKGKPWVKTTFGHRWHVHKPRQRSTAAKIDRRPALYAACCLAGIATGEGHRRHSNGVYVRNRGFLREPKTTSFVVFFLLREQE